VTRDIIITIIIIIIITITIITLLDTSFYYYRLLLAVSSYLCFVRYCSLGLCYNCVKRIAHPVKNFFPQCTSVATQYCMTKENCRGSVQTLARNENCYVFNPLNTQLNPVCHLLALLEAHHILHVTRIRVK